MPKNITTKIGCGCFDQLDMQLLNNYIFLYFILRLKFLNFWGL